MGADSPAENTPNALKKFQPKMSAQAQKFWVSVVRGWIQYIVYASYLWW